MANFFQRGKSAIIGMLVGFVFVPGAVALHSWNEYRTIHRTIGLAEAREVAQTIDNVERLETELDGQLVHLSGRATTAELLSDPIFGIEENAIRLRREVEMYQWEEDVDKDSDGHETIRHSKTWEKNRIDSSRFKREVGHENPQLPYPSESHMAQLVNVGVYELNERLKKSIDAWEPIEISEAGIRETVGEKDAGNFLVVTNQLFWRAAGLPTPDSPEIGDVRIRFERVLPNDVSLMAGLNGTTFDSFKTDNGEDIETLYMGSLTSDEIVDQLETDNAVMAWILRVAGLAICFAGFMMILGPIRAMVSWIPLLGDLTGFVLFLVAGLLAVIVSLTTISIAWLAVRPIFGIGLLVAVAVACFLVYRLRGRSEPSRSGHEPTLVTESMFAD
jgi:hypothetical protein